MFSGKFDYLLLEDNTLLFDYRAALKKISAKKRRFTACGTEFWNKVKICLVDIQNIVCLQIEFFLSSQSTADILASL